VIGEANFSDHGANRLGASALMQGLADGYFILPVTIGDWLVTGKPAPVQTTHPAFKEALDGVRAQTERLLAINGKRTVSDFHRELGSIMWNECGMGRTRESLTRALEKIPQLREEFWRDVKVTGRGMELNQQLEAAGRVADFLELGELVCQDALHREESAGGHFREEYQTPEGEALRNDDDFAYVAVWEYAGAGQPAKLNKEPLEFENVHLTQRSYK
jgi:succinate dehydrogenase / fumarate reductase flavoprotein subunit